MRYGQFMPAMITLDSHVQRAQVGLKTINEMLQKNDFEKALSCFDAVLDHVKNARTLCQTIHEKD